jgi:hypothetical protein
VAPEYTEAWDAACKLFESLTEVGAASTPYTEALNIVAVAMGMNYWVSEAELRALELFSHDELLLGAQAIVDWPTFLKLQEVEDERKKKAGSSSA